MARWKIDSRLRQAAFLAQVGHESSQLCNLVENLNYRADRIRQIGQASAAAHALANLLNSAPSWFSEQ
ncbi:hypothetical protein ACYT86_28835, partial [Pseudomonas idahonensis]